jgi:hypothetical protein
MIKMMFVFTTLALAATATVRPAAEERHKEDKAALVKALSRSKVSLVDGVRQLSKGTEAALSAKYEFDGSGKLSLSVYTAEKGLGQDAEHNVLKEFQGSPEQAAWSPAVEVFADFAHIARSAQQHALLAVSGRSLLDFAALAEKEGKGTLLSITPVLEGRSASIRVQFVSGERIVEARYPLHADDDEADEKNH